MGDNEFPPSGVTPSGIVVVRRMPTPEEVFSDGQYEEVPPPTQLKSAEIATRLTTNVFGQDPACEAISRALVNYASGFRDTRRPLSMIFFGPTGVGKTESARTAAEVLFPNNPKARTITIDCTALQEASSITRLKGSDPKYVGFGTDVLIMPEKIKDGAVIIVDEIEKAHPEIWKWFMGPLEDGETKLFLPSAEASPDGSTGKKIVPTVLDFRKTVIIFTSNEGAEQMQEQRRGIHRHLGFQTENQHLAPRLNYTKIIEDVLRTGKFRGYPEFLGRIDHRVIFNDLAPEHYGRIFDKFLAQALQDQAANDHSNGISMTVTEELRQWIIAQSNIAEFGGRNIRAALKKTLLSVAADYKTSGAFARNAFVLAYLDNNQIKFRQRRLDGIPQKPTGEKKGKTPEAQDKPQAKDQTTALATIFPVAADI